MDEQELEHNTDMDNPHLLFEVRSKDTKCSEMFQLTLTTCR